MFIDDLCTFNNNKCENNYKDIEPSELELKKESQNPCFNMLLHLIRRTTDLTDIIKGDIFLLIWLKEQAMNLPISFHYIKRYLGNTLKCFKSLQIQLINLSSFSLCNYFCVYACIYTCILWVFCLYVYMLESIYDTVFRTDCYKDL